MDTSAEHIIRKCGGVQAVADLLGIDTTSVHKWKYPRCRGGTDGRVPTGRQAELLRLARVAGIDLNPDDFFAASRPVEEASARQNPSSLPTKLESETQAASSQSASCSAPADRTTGAAA